MRKASIMLVAWLFSHGLQAQFKLSGTVRSQTDAEPLVGATVQLDGSSSAAVTDGLGYFRIPKVPAGEHRLTIRFLGYSDVETSILIQSDTTLRFSMEESATLTDEVLVEATRASNRGVLTSSTIGRDQVMKQNFAQDMPILLNWMPSVVTTSDAGAGVGYTGIRIRGSDPTRINVTINGIPYNDSESLGTFWVNVPDIASSTQSIQIQRGVGTSTNGAGAFGGTINLQTNTLKRESYAEATTSAGSFNTFKNSIAFGTGLINGTWAIDGRASRITSDGFIDRASSDLSSYYVSAGYYADKTMVKALAFGGRERTYQSWWGVPESRLNDDLEAMLTTAANEGWNEEQTNNLLTSDSRTFNPYLYKNQVDNYGQDHYQMHLSQRVAETLTFNTSFHYTKGSGYYEEYRYDDDIADYGLPDVVVDDDGIPDDNDTITTTDVIRRRWLDNDFYGLTFSIQRESESLDLTLGGAWNQYDGDHFGEILWSEKSIAPHEYRYYFNSGKKRDVNLYLKGNFTLSDRLSAFADLQVRNLAYEAGGIANKQNTFVIDQHYTFFNPKLGATINFSQGQMAYASYSVGNREPVRDDFIDNQGAYPLPERLNDWEVGYRHTSEYFAWSVTGYLMDYQNQLVLTGKLNDVGATIRTNVDNSYRAGIEWEGKLRLSKNLTWDLNLTLSRNKIAEFTEVLYDYGADWDEYNEVVRTYTDTDISFSPNIIAGSSISYEPFNGVEFAVLSKYVGKQYLDNTSNNDRSIDAYFTHDVRLSYATSLKLLRELRLSVLLNNVTNSLYSSNGYTWGYLGGGDEYRENYYYPQAGFHFMTMLSLKF